MKLVDGKVAGLKAVLFWGDTSDLIYAERAPVRNPGDWVTPTPERKKNIVAEYLNSGKSILQYLGYADCRMCGIQLGTSDVCRDGFVWPEQASHYVLKHNVWVPEHEELFAMLSWRVIRP